MRDFVEEAIAAIDEWQAEPVPPIKDGRLGLLACANAQAVTRIREGTAPIKTLRTVLDYVRDHPHKPLETETRKPTTKGAK